MYKNLNIASLGVSGRQSEIIELTLTYGFRGLDLDLADFSKRAELYGVDHAKRFIESAKRTGKLRMGCFELPIKWNGPDGEFNSELVALGKSAELANILGAKVCIVSIPASADRPYHDNFELTRKRLGEMSKVLAKHDIRLGASLQAAPNLRGIRQHQFIYRAEELLTLVKTINNPNVGIALDTWNWYVGEGSFDQIQDAKGKVISVRLADAPAEVATNALTDTQRVLPGVGVGIPAAKVASWLVQTNYDGPVTICPHPSCFTGMTRESILQRVSTLCDDLWVGAGLPKPLRPAAIAAAAAASAPAMSDV